VSRRSANMRTGASLWIVGAVCLAAAALTGWWALRPLPSQVQLATAAPTKSSDSTVELPQTVTVPPNVLTVTLRDALIDAPAAVAPSVRAPALPRLDLQLIAITGEGESRSLFALDNASGEYLEMRIGDTTPQGAKLLSLDMAGALFRLAGREIRLELTP